MKKLLLAALVALTGCDSSTQSKTAQEPIPPYVETKSSDNFIRLEFTHVEADPANKNMVNYAKAIREWAVANPGKKIVTIMGWPLSTGKGLKGIWIKTAAKSPGEIQRVIQLDLPSELPEEFTIATLYFENSEPAGIIGLTP